MWGLSTDPSSSGDQRPGSRVAAEFSVLVRTASFFNLWASSLLALAQGQRVTCIH